MKYLSIVAAVLVLFCGQGSGVESGGAEQSPPAAVGDPEDSGASRATGELTLDLTVSRAVVTLNFEPSLPKSSRMLNVRLASEVPATVTLSDFWVVRPGENEPVRRLRPTGEPFVLSTASTSIAFGAFEEGDIVGMDEAGPFRYIKFKVTIEDESGERRIEIDPLDKDYGG